MVLVGDYELCRGGVPAPSPPTEDAQRVYDACVAAAETDSTVAGEKGQIGSLPQGNCEVCMCGIGEGERGMLRPKLWLNT